MGFLIVVVVVVAAVVVTGENKVNSYSDQLKLGQVYKSGAELDKTIFGFPTLR